MTTAVSSTNRYACSCFGVRSYSLLFDNDLPEGRFYCRTVQITVKTPVE